MIKPEVTLENYEAVYDYYEQYTQPLLGARFCHYALSKVFRPQVQYASGVADELIDLVDSGSRVVLAWNHMRDTDQYVIAAAAQREVPLRPMRGNTFIQSKESIFNDHKKKQPLRHFQRVGADVLGGLPTFRKKDIQELTDMSDEQKEDFYKSAIARLLDATVHKMVKGQHMAIFPEGERNKDFPETVQPLKPGLAKTIGLVVAHCDVAVFPVGFTYGAEAKIPQVYFGEPILCEEGLFDQQAFLDRLHDDMQESVDQARYNARLIV